VVRWLTQPVRVTLAVSCPPSPLAAVALMNKVSSWAGHTRPVLCRE